MMMLDDTSCMFFFSSRRRHTRFDCDWSSDVCSSDLDHQAWADAAKKWFIDGERLESHEMQGSITFLGPDMKQELGRIDLMNRSEERRVGKECRSRWAPVD